MYQGDKASEHIKITYLGEQIEFTALAWDFVITKELDVFNGRCLLKTNKLVFDENNYPNKIMKHIPDMDIVIRLPFSSSECFRFVQDDNVQQTLGKNADGTPMTVSTNRAIIHNFPIQYINKLYSVIQKIQTSK